MVCQYYGLHYQVLKGVPLLSISSDPLSCRSTVDILDVETAFGKV
jgi:hypothetical protein